MTQAQVKKIVQKRADKEFIRQMRKQFKVGILSEEPIDPALRETFAYLFIEFHESMKYIWEQMKLEFKKGLKQWKK